MFIDLRSRSGAADYIRIEDRDIYSLEQQLAQINMAVLKKLVMCIDDGAAGIPMDLMDAAPDVPASQGAFSFIDTATEEAQASLAGAGRWRKIICEMIYGFEFTLRRADFFLECTSQEFEAKRARAQDGLNLYGKYFDQLFA